MLNAGTARAHSTVDVQGLPGPQVVAQNEAECASHSGGNADSQAGRMSAGENEELIGFEEATRILGMGPRSLRKIIQRSRERIEGRRTSGPTIRFFQCHPKAAIKFRREWLEDFIRQHTHDPGSPFLHPADVPRRKAKKHETLGFGLQGESTEPALGFDSSLYNL